MPDVDALFLEELARRGVTPTRDDEGNYNIDIDGTTLSVSLFNLRKDVARDGDLERITNFVETVLAAAAGMKIPSWDEAKPWVRWQMEPIDSPLEDILHDQVSDQVALVLVLASPDESQIRFISEGTATEWGQTKESLLAVAGDNMAAMVEQAEITFEEIDGHKLGMIGTEWTAYKAALVFSRGFRPKVEPVLGWPVFAVMPCRDFVYVMPAADKELLPRLGVVVAKEFRKGAYPLSTEVFELTDAGIRATFEFQKPPAGNLDLPDDPAWRIVQYGGFLRFRVPVQWTDEPVQRATEYFDPQGVGRLMVIVVGKQSDTPVTVADGRTDGSGELGVVERGHRHPARLGDVAGGDSGRGVRRIDLMGVDAGGGRPTESGSHRVVQVLRSDGRAGGRAGAGGSRAGDGPARGGVRVLQAEPDARRRKASQAEARRAQTQAGQGRQELTAVIAPGRRPARGRRCA